MVVVIVRPSVCKPTSTHEKIMDLQDIKRKHFRISVKDNDAVSLKINNVPYELIDISDHGIGVQLGSEDILVAVGDELPLEITMDGQVHNLQGKVVHINPLGPEDYLCGIEFINMGEKTKAAWTDYLRTFREKIFREE